MANINNIITITKKHLTRYEYDEVIKYCDMILETNPESFFGLRFKAISYYQKGKYKQALDLYCKMYKLDPRDEDIIYMMAILNQELGNDSEALKFYDKLSESKEIMSKRKRLLTRMEKYQELIDEYDDRLHEIENAESCDIQGRIVLLEEKAIFLYRNNDSDEAYNTFKEAIPLYELISEHIPRKKEQNKWFTMINTTLTNSTNATDFFNQFLNIEENMDSWIYKIEKYFSEYEDPLVFADMALELEPENVKLLESIAESTLYHDTDYALECWKKLLELEPENTRAIEAILDIYSRQYAKDRQLKLIDEKLYINSIRYNLLERKIRLLESMTLYDEALESYDEYLEIEKPDELSYKYLTTFDRLMCMEQQALDLYIDNKLEESFDILREVSQRYKKLENNSPGISSVKWKLDDWYNNVLINSMNKSHDNHEIFFEEFYSIKSESLALWSKKIEFLIDSKHFGNPITYCNILEEKTDDKIKVILIKGYVYYKTKRLDNALVEFNRVLDIQPDNDEAKNYKFCILVQKKDYEKAYKFLESTKINFKIIHYDLSQLAHTLCNQEQYDKAVKCYEIILNEDFSPILVDKVKVLWKKTGDVKRLEESKYYMDWINIIKSRYDTDVCPDCGKKLIPIIYGLPAPELLRSDKNGEDYILGGCLVSYDNPTDYCKNCEKGVKIEPYGIEIIKDDHDLYRYCRLKINQISGVIARYPENTIDQLEKKALEYRIDAQEFEALIEKFIEIGYAKRNKDHLKLLKTPGDRYGERFLTKFEGYLLG